MRTNYGANAGVRFNMFSQDQLEELFNGVLHILEYTGLDVYHEEAREILKKAGAWVEGERVRVPSYLVKSLRMAPRSFTLWARDGDRKKNISIGPGRAHFGPGPTCPNFIDPETLERRPYTKQDVPLVAKLVDALPNIDFCESLGTVGNVQVELSATYEFAGMFPNTSKPIVAWSYNWEDSADIHRIAVTEAGGQAAFERRPNYVHYCEPLSPLISTFEALDKLIFAATPSGPARLHALPDCRRHRSDDRRRPGRPGRGRILDGLHPRAGALPGPAVHHGRRAVDPGHVHDGPAYGAPELALSIRR